MVICNDLWEGCLHRKPNPLNPSARPVSNLVAHAPDVLPVAILAGIQSGSDPPGNPNTPPVTDGPSDHNLYKDYPHGKRKHLSTDASPVSTVPAPGNNTSTNSIAKRRKRLSPDEPALSTTVDSLSHDSSYKGSPNHIPLVLVATNGESGNNSSKDSLCRKYKLDVEVTQEKVFQRGEARGELHGRELPGCGEWKVGGKIGKGASGSVYLHRKEGTGVVRAVKRLVRDNWKLEWELINLIRVIDRPDLFVQFHGWYENHDFVFYAMEYLEHGDLGEYIEKNPEQVVKNAREISRQILEGLVVLHERRICHRDLKPQNVLIASLSPIHIKLADFGISKCEADSMMKTTGVGTMGYIAPEVLRFMDKESPVGHQYTSAVDMWSFGCLVHVMLTGKQPFTQSGSFSLPNFARFCDGQTKLVDTILFAHVKDPFALDFVKRLLIQDGSQRMSASEALGHEWITNASLVNATCD